MFVIYWLLKKSITITSAAALSTSTKGLVDLKQCLTRNLEQDLSLQKDQVLSRLALRARVGGGAGDLVRQGCRGEPQGRVYACLQCLPPPETGLEKN